MSRILITSGPTRQYLDPVRYLTNASSGRMGAALAEAAVEAGHRVVVVSGPVEVAYPPGVEVIEVLSTQEMLDACQKVFPGCDGLIAAAAPCDYQPAIVSPQKIRKSGAPVRLELVETPDIVASLAGRKGPRWIVAFALETEDRRARAMQKLTRKNCDLIVVNGPKSLHSSDASVEILDRSGRLLEALSADKRRVAEGILRVIQREAISRQNGDFSVKEK
jgi:phosphopantothenoylcysteine decarboxylase/phosphopantothenate--cysteine ligase